MIRKQVVRDSVRARPSQNNTREQQTLILRRGKITQDGIRLRILYDKFHLRKALEHVFYVNDIS